jgi:hypothetical protein
VKNILELELEKSLKSIRNCQLDIELLKRENEKLCSENNNEITKLEFAIDAVEKSLEEELKESGEDKLECKLGSVSFKIMPDEWKYQDEILMAWIISLPARLKGLFLKVVTSIKKAELKKQIMADNEILFENSKLIDEDISHIELFLVDEEKSYLVEGIEIKRQEPKFNYTIKNLKK